MIEITESAARVIDAAAGEAAASPAAACASPSRPAAARASATSFALGRARRATPTRCSKAPSGAKVFVDPRSLKLLDGTVLDFDEDNLMATSFTLEEPAREEHVRMRRVVFGLSRLKPQASGPQELYEHINRSQSKNWRTPNTSTGSSPTSSRTSSRRASTRTSSA